MYFAKLKVISIKYWYKSPPTPIENHSNQDKHISNKSKPQTLFLANIVTVMRPNLVVCVNIQYLHGAFLYFSYTYPIINAQDFKEIEHISWICTIFWHLVTLKIRSWCQNYAAVKNALSRSVGGWRKSWNRMYKCIFFTVNMPQVGHLELFLIQKRLTSSLHIWPLWYHISTWSKELGFPLSTWISFDNPNWPWMKGQRSTEDADFDTNLRFYHLYCK